MDVDVKISDYVYILTIIMHSNNQYVKFGTSGLEQRRAGRYAPLSTASAPSQLPPWAPFTYRTNKQTTTSLLFNGSSDGCRSRNLFHSISPRYGNAPLCWSDDTPSMTSLPHHSHIHLKLWMFRPHPGLPLAIERSLLPLWESGNVVRAGWKQSCLRSSFRSKSSFSSPTFLLLHLLDTLNFKFVLRLLLKTLLLSDFLKRQESQSKYFLHD
jgi:hypothetical protein